ncbi:MAG: MarR family transcriptional regulator, partial [Spirochaetales bacterium]|nr:MarR family transcriptional regulator [Spirochaetales bacterium]
MVRNYQFRILNKILRDYPVPVTPPEYYLLSSIQENPGMTQYRLSQISGYSVQRCSQMLQKLEDLELTVVKSAEGYSTGRHIHATGAGERVIHEIYDLFSGYQDGALSGEERRLLAELDIP